MYDYYTSDFPLCAPVTKGIRTEKFYSHIRNLFGRNKFLANFDCIHVQNIDYHGVEYGTEVHAIMKSIIEQASCDIDRHLIITSNNIELIRVSELYEQYWNRFILEPMVSDQLEFLLPLRDEVSLIKEYYTAETKVNNLYYEDLIARPLFSRKYIDSLFIPKDLRSIIVQYLN